MDKDSIKIAKTYLAIHKIVGNNVTQYCSALRIFLNEYKKDKGLTGDEILDIDDFMRWVEANKYDWIDKLKL